MLPNQNAGSGADGLESSGCYIQLLGRQGYENNCSTEMAQMECRDGGSQTNLPFVGFRGCGRRFNRDYGGQRYQGRLCGFFLHRLGRR